VNRSSGGGDIQSHHENLASTAARIFWPAMDSVRPRGGQSVIGCHHRLDFHQLRPFLFHPATLAGMQRHGPPPNWNTLSPVAGTFRNDSPQLTNSSKGRHLARKAEMR